MMKSELKFLWKMLAKQRNQHSRIQTEFSFFIFLNVWMTQFYFRWLKMKAEEWICILFIFIISSVLIYIIHKTCVGFAFSSRLKAYTSYENSHTLSNFQWIRYLAHIQLLVNSIFLLKIYFQRKSQI